MSTWREALAGKVAGEATADAPLAPRTAIRVGGPADLLVRPAHPDDLAVVLKACREDDVPFLALGGGTNLLVADAGVRGVVVKLAADFGAEEVRAGRLVLSAAAPSSRLIGRAQRLGLVGCEFMAGIPGTLGGLVAMNAGTRQGEMKDIVTRVELATADGCGWLEAGELAFGYRTCRLLPGAVVTRVEVSLPGGDVVESAAAMRADVERRRATQPLQKPNFGSTFRNPPGDYAGRLIEAVGLKGERAGGAAISTVHANFIVNEGGAKARDVLNLVNLARKRVRQAFGVLLEPEVRLVGDFGQDGGIL